MDSYFEGFYYKHQKGSTVICFIAGRADGADFIQVITNEKVYHYNSRQGIRISRKGYIEGDRGCSFPQKYLWLYSNDFKQPLSIMTSVADIPFLGFHFMGCICAILYQGKEYRLATYRGVKINQADDGRLVLTQGRYRLDVKLAPRTSYTLKSPLNGNMTGTIHESNCTQARFRFWDRNRILFDLLSENTSFECNLNKI